MAILITGGAGYIGSMTAHVLAERGRDVVILDSLEKGYRAAVAGFPLIEGQITDSAAVQKAVADYDVDAVIHFAAYKAAGESMVDPGKYFSNNTAGSAALIESLSEAGVDKFVFSSTAAVYGTPKQMPVAEDAALTPENPYGESKLLVERILRWYDECKSFRSVSLRYFNAAGAAMDGSRGEDWSVALNLVPVAIKAALGASGPLHVFGTDYPTRDGTAIRDYIHVIDLATAHVAALDYLASGGDTTVVNLGTGQGATVAEVISTIEQLGDVEVPKVLSGRRAGDPVEVYADNRRAQQLLDWRPQFGLGEIISSAWAWHSSHPDGYQ